MAWTTPRTWVTGELVTAALLNTHLRDNLNAANDVITLSPAEFTANFGTPAAGAQSEWAVLLFDGAAIEAASAARVIPVGWVTATIHLYWTAASGTGNVLWRIDYASVGDTETIGAYSVSSINAAIAAPAANTIKKTTTSAVAVTAGELFSVKVQRTGNHATDTLDAVDAAVIGVEIRRAS